MSVLDTVTDIPGLACAEPGGALDSEALRCHKPGPVPDDDDDDEDDDRGSSGGNIDHDDDEGDFDDDEEDEDETLWTRRHPDRAGANSFAHVPTNRVYGAAPPATLAD